MKLLKMIMIFTIMNVFYISAATYFMSFADSIEAETVLEKSNGDQVEVDIKLFQYKPADIEVSTGTTVIWKNNDAIEHSITHGTPENSGDEFDSEFFTKEQSYSMKFEKEGEYPYFCKRHPSMKGKVVVTSR
ncbi:MAG TPA: plastocyanin/azurin family copper-binding protein [Thermodesulfobacteriota bacterium]|nr:plastocyanin/azurin family copper-binding protein [Thermodesulfobacteriota bacterium]